LPRAAGGYTIEGMKLWATTALITGSSGSLGREIALALAGAGCDCICHYHHNGEIAEQLAEEIIESGRKAVAVGADLTDAAQVRDVFARAGGLAAPRILINSAAIFARQALADVTVEMVRKILDTNLIAPVLVSGEFVRVVNENYSFSDGPVAKIINLADVGAIRPWAEYSVYCASKAGVVAVTKSLAKELAPGFCVNAIAPGMIAWGGLDDPKEKAKQLKFIPAGRFGNAADITNAVIFLLENDYITGQTLNVDGGRCM